MLVARTSCAGAYEGSIGRGCVPEIEMCKSRKLNLVYLTCFVWGY